MGCLKAYVTIIFKIVTAPLELAMGAFPNSKMGFGTWVWDLIANLAIFPVSLIFMVVGNMIIDFSKKGMWAPSVISNLSIPSAVVTTIAIGDIISVGIGIALISLIAKLPDMIPEFIFSIKPSPWGKAIGEGLNVSRNPAIGFGAGLATDMSIGKLRKQWNARNIQEPGQPAPQPKPYDFVLGPVLDVAEEARKKKK